MYMKYMIRRRFMKRYNAICPVCKAKNMDLFLEETDGWMVCEKCGRQVRVMEFIKPVKLPVYTMEHVSEMLKNGTWETTHSFA